MMDPMARVRRGFRAVMPPYQGLLSAAETGALVEYIRYLSTRPAETRLSPLAPPGSPSVRLPESAPTELERGAVPSPIGGTPSPRPDGPPYPPEFDDSPAGSVEALP
jgi:hypothetical protein